MKIKLFFILYFLAQNFVLANQEHYLCNTWGGQIIPIHANVLFNYYQRTDSGGYQEVSGNFDEGYSMVIGHDGERNGCYAMIVDRDGYVLDGQEDLVILPSIYIERTLNFEAAQDANDLMEFVRSAGVAAQPDCNRSGTSNAPVTSPRPPERPTTIEDIINNSEVPLNPITGFQGLDRTVFAHDNCEKFVDASGELGEYGNMVYEYFLEESEDSSLFANDMPGMTDGTKTCPNWPNFTREQKIHYWAYALAAIADDESGCRANARNPNGTDGVAIGLLQMPERRRGQKGYYWRGDNCRATPQGEMDEPRNNIRCSLDILKESMLGREGVYQNTRGLVGGNIYWEKLRHGDGGDIGPLLASYQACFE